MSDENKSFVKRKLHALKQSKISISTPLPGNKGIYSKLRYDVFQGNPRIIVDTKDPNLGGQENKFGRIEAAMEPITFQCFLENLEKAIKAPSEFKEIIQCHNHEFSSQGRGDVAHLCDVIVGKDGEGNVYISVISTKNNWPKIKFIYALPDQRYHQMVHGDGTPWTKAEISIQVAKGHLQFLRESVPLVIQFQMDQTDPNSFGNKPGGNGGGGWKGKGQGGGGGWKGNGGGGNGGGGWNKPQRSNDSGGDAKPSAGFSDMDDDQIPF